MEASIKENSDSKEDVNLLYFAKMKLKLKDIDVHNYSALSLAYIGDAVYELAVRTKIVNHGNLQVSKMNKRASNLAKASTQAAIIHALKRELTTEEEAVYKRGRNAKSATMAKNATMIDYRVATGFEALIGYLYLTEQYERLIVLISRGLEEAGELE